MAFGQWIRAKREEANIMLIDFARDINISPAYWSRIERGLESPPRDQLIERAAAILGMQMDDLFVMAQRLPPDMRTDMEKVVRAYRRLRSMNGR